MSSRVDLAFASTDVVDADMASGQRWEDGTCVMHHQLTDVCKQVYCVNCAPFVLAQDLSKLKQPS